jgi:small subunit ribosomal protein S6
MAENRTYELVMILDPGLETEQTESELRRYQEFIAANGQSRRWERWGKRRLAYEIRGKQYGFYALVVFDLTAAMVTELDRLVRLNNNVIRHLLTIVEPKRVPEIDLEAVRTLGITAVPTAIVDVETPATDAGVPVPVIPEIDILDETADAISDEI